MDPVNENIVSLTDAKPRPWEQDSKRFPRHLPQK